MREMIMIGQIKKGWRVAIQKKGAMFIVTADRKGGYFAKNANSVEQAKEFYREMLADIDRMGK